MALRNSTDQNATGSGEDGDTVLRFFHTPSPAEYTFDFFSRNESLALEVQPDQELELASPEEDPDEAKDYSIYIRNEDHHLAMRNAAEKRWQMESSNQDRELQQQAQFGCTTISDPFARDEKKISPVHLQQQPVVNAANAELQAPHPFHRAPHTSSYIELASNLDTVFHHNGQLVHDSSRRGGDELHQSYASTSELDAHSRPVLPEQQFYRGSYGQQTQSLIPQTTSVGCHPLQTSNAALEHLLHYGNQETQHHDETSHVSIFPEHGNLDHPVPKDQTSRPDAALLGLDGSLSFDHQFQPSSSVIAAGSDHHLAAHPRADTGKRQFQNSIRIRIGPIVDGPPGSHPSLKSNDGSRSVGQAGILQENSQVSVSQSYVGLRHALQSIPAPPFAVGHDDPFRQVAEDTQLQLQLHGTLGPDAVADPERCYVPLLAAGPSVSAGQYRYPPCEIATIHSSDLRPQSAQEHYHQQPHGHLRAGRGCRKHHPPQNQRHSALPSIDHASRSFEEQHQLGQDLSIQPPEDHLFPAHRFQTIEDRGHITAAMSSADLEISRIAERSVSHLELARRLYERSDASGTQDHQQHPGQHQQLLLPFHHSMDIELARAAQYHSSDVSGDSHDAPHPSPHLKSKARYLESLSISAAGQEEYQVHQLPGVCCQQFLDDFQVGAQADLELGFHIPGPSQQFGQNGGHGGSESLHAYAENLPENIFQGMQNQGRELEVRQDLINFGNQGPTAYCSAQITKEQQQGQQEQEQQGQERELNLSPKERLFSDHDAEARNVSPGSGHAQPATSNESFPRYIKLTEFEMVQALRQYKTIHQEITIPPVIVKEADVYRLHPTSLVREKGTHYFFVDTRYSSLKKPTRLRITATKCRWKQQGRMFPIRENGEVVAFKTYLSYVRLKGSAKRTKDGSASASSTSHGKSSGSSREADRAATAAAAADSRKAALAAPAGADDRKWSTWTMEEIALVEEITAEKMLLKRGKKPRAFSVICRLVHKREIPSKKPLSFLEKKRSITPNYTNAHAQDVAVRRNGNKKLKGTEVAADALTVTVGNVAKPGLRDDDYSGDGRQILGKDHRTRSHSSFERHGSSSTHGNKKISINLGGKRAG